MSKKKQQTKSDNSKFTEDWLPIKGIQGGYITVPGGGILEGDQIVTGVRIEPKNIFISDSETQNMTITALRLSLIHIL